jgi:chromosome segregation ATPase
LTKQVEQLTTDLAAKTEKLESIIAEYTTTRKELVSVRHTLETTTTHKDDLHEKLQAAQAELSTTIDKLSSTFDELKSTTAVLLDTKEKLDAQIKVNTELTTTIVTLKREMKVAADEAEQRETNLTKQLDEAKDDNLKSNEEKGALIAELKDLKSDYAALKMASKGYEPLQKQIAELKNDARVSDEMRAKAEKELAKEREELANTIAFYTKQVDKAHAESKSAILDGQKAVKKVEERIAGLEDTITQLKTKVADAETAKAKAEEDLKDAKDEMDRSKKYWAQVKDEINPGKGRAR